MRSPGKVAAKIRSYQALTTRRAGNRQRSRTFGNKLSVEHEEWNPAEVIGMEMCEQTRSIAARSMWSRCHADQRGCAAIDQEPGVFGCHMETRVEPTARAEGIAGAHERELHAAPPVTLGRRYIEAWAGGRNTSLSFR